MALIPNIINTKVKMLTNTESTNSIASGWTAGNNGSRVQEFKICTGPTTAPGASVLTINAYDGATGYPIHEVTLTNTANVEVTTLYESNLTLASGWSIQLQMRTAITAGGSASTTIIGYDY